MSLCKSGQIINCCHPNALMTLSEYMTDYASDKTKEHGMKMIKSEIEKVSNPKVKERAIQYINEIETTNARDFRF